MRYEGKEPADLLTKDCSFVCVDVLRYLLPEIVNVNTWLLMAFKNTALTRQLRLERLAG
jgi:hypothetical protein